MAQKPKEIIEKIFWIESQLQLLHWREPKSGFKHEVLGKYYSSMQSFLDLFVETYGGIFGKEAIALGDSLYAVKNNEVIDVVIDDILTIITEFRAVFETQPALVNILDDILTETYKNKYLLSFE